MTTTSRRSGTAACRDVAVRPRLLDSVVLTEVLLVVRGEEPRLRGGATVGGSRADPRPTGCTTAPVRTPAVPRAGSRGPCCHPGGCSSPMRAQRVLGGGVDLGGCRGVHRREPAPVRATV